MALRTRAAKVVSLDGVLLKPFFPPTRPKDVFGSLGHAGSPKTLNEMEAGASRQKRDGVMLAIGTNLVVAIWAATTPAICQSRALIDSTG